MAWGSSAPHGVDDWVQRLRRDDPTLTSITVLKGRTFDHEVRAGQPPNHTERCLICPKGCLSVTQLNRLIQRHLLNAEESQ